MSRPVQAGIEPGRPPGRDYQEIQTADEYFRPAPRWMGDQAAAWELCSMSLSNLLGNLRRSMAQKQKDRSRGSVVVSHVVRSAKTSGVTVTTLDAGTGDRHTGAGLTEAALAGDRPSGDRAAFTRARSMVGADRTRSQWLDEFPGDGGGRERMACLADVPSEIRERIKEDELVRIIRRLETPLRALHAATSRKGVEYPADELRHFLLIWRQALGDYLTLLPDERSVLVYESGTDDSYFVRGRCEPGSHIVVLEPCWTLNGRVVVRGEARVIEDARLLEDSRVSQDANASEDANVSEDAKDSEDARAPGAAAVTGGAVT
ncbi:MAG: hypothetical protein LC772_01165 [Chloroflexi bacterium]|nr:hypothetical protein [Chloroflexota bacterium]